uniref:Riorf145 protein n=1 Tax=Rhizobium rhizogenes TaxID=359 RepID=Q7AJI7_RHIRH|nr:riorf145 [Rhizobium rhizogenes]
MPSSSQRTPPRESESARVKSDPASPNRNLPSDVLAKVATYVPTTGCGRNRTRSRKSRANWLRRSRSFTSRPYRNLSRSREKDWYIGKSSLRYNHPWGAIA